MNKPFVSKNIENNIKLKNENNENNENVTRYRHR